MVVFRVAGGRESERRSRTGRHGHLHGEAGALSRRQKQGPSAGETLAVRAIDRPHVRHARTSTTRPSGQAITYGWRSSPLSVRICCRSRQASIPYSCPQPAQQRVPCFMALWRRRSPTPKVDTPPALFRRPPSFSPAPRRGSTRRVASVRRRSRGRRRGDPSAPGRRACARRAWLAFARAASPCEQACRRRSAGWARAPAARWRGRPLCRWGRVTDRRRGSRGRGFP